MNLRLSRRRLFQLASAGAALATLSGKIPIYAQPEFQPQFQPSNVITQLAPGLTLQSVQTLAPVGPLRFWIVKADPKLINLGLEIADKTNVVKKRSVRNLADQAKSIVAINGGFFAYGGGAVGAVKTDNVWQRLPWRNRTALGWNSKSALINPLNGNLQIDLRRGNQLLVRGAKRRSTALICPANAQRLSTDLFCYRHNSSRLTFCNQAKRRRRLKTEKSLDSTLIKPKCRCKHKIIYWSRVAQWRRGCYRAPLRRPIICEWEIQSTPAIWADYPTIIGAGPRLVANGRVQTNEVEEEFQPDVIARGPRTAVGWDKDRNWLFLVADGRQVTSVGLTIPETATLFAQMGAVEAMNLDGGSSTQLIINGELANTPSALDPVDPTHRREVQVSNALTLKLK